MTLNDIKKANQEPFYSSKDEQAKLQTQLQIIIAEKLDIIIDHLKKTNSESNKVDDRATLQSLARRKLERLRRI